MSTKPYQLQIRVTAERKEALRRLARDAGLDLSAYVLSRALPDGRLRFAAIIRGLREHGDHTFAMAELNHLLATLSPSQLPDALAVAPEELRDLPLLLQNYVGAMVEQACHRLRTPAPAWVEDIPPLDDPHFASPLLNLRRHLLATAPVAFKRRNLFVDPGTRPGG